jgi:hypothetical protein
LRQSLGLYYYFDLLNVSFPMLHIVGALLTPGKLCTARTVAVEDLNGRGDFR